MVFDYLTIPGDYSGYNILEEEKETISKYYESWVKTLKRDMERESNVNFLQ